MIKMGAVASCWQGAWLSVQWKCVQVASVTSQINQISSQSNEDMSESLKLSDNHVWQPISNLKRSNLGRFSYTWNGLKDEVVGLWAYIVLISNLTTINVQTQQCEQSSFPVCYNLDNSMNRANFLYVIIWSIQLDKHTQKHTVAKHSLEWYILKAYFFALTSVAGQTWNPGKYMRESARTASLSRYPYR